MAKLLLFSDIHIYNHKNSIRRLQDCLDVLRWALESARDRRIKSVLFLGDLFHDRQKIQVLAYQKAYEIIREYDDLELYLLLGNHDLWYHDLWDVSSVSPFGAMKHVYIIDAPSTYEIQGLNIDFLPFTHNPVKILAEHFVYKSKVLCAHIAIDGAQLNKVYNTRAEVAVEHDNDMVKVDVGLFGGWKKVFLGHYHGEQRLDDVIEYIGSPLQLSFNEAFQNKHLVVLDTDTLAVDYIENTFSPKHLIINRDDIDKHDLTNNFVEVNVDVTNSLDIADLRKKLLEENTIQHLEFREKKKRESKVTDEKIEKFDLMHGDVLERYLAVENGKLDKCRLLKLGREILEETK